ncbi:PREDICTED: potassium/sodium hyperpolarization-activated cyclic nucleotide-gated channel 1-like [Nicrophorus vespilloides]|uniref:Potassium/sodium hyperpolarization-activated cyclic nucleotide-gated channel 1-like n=1 Tax=Nicrophorus vespilloides TaxID=110193 RepID=A0ABM1MS91_NICVS|nr:PREDICTED: potassium/sodium hyperpolarization-activated cyclic nucleotide-gated channel 1-like [Nicrophorus vespilloides]
MASFGFYCDLVCSIPIYLITGVICKIYPSLRISKVLRICEIVTMFKFLRIKKFLKYLGHTTELIRHYYYSRRSLKYLLVSLLALHWSTCMYISISEWFYYFNHDNEYPIPSLSTRNALLYDYLSIYCQSLHKVSSYLLGVSIVTGFRRTVYFQITEPRELTCFLIFSPIGYIFCNLLLVLVLQMIISMNSSEIKYNEILSQVNCYMSHKDLPNNMKERILSYYDYRFQKKYFRESTIMAMLSETLRRDINLHSCRTLIDSVPLLKDLPSEIISEVVHHLRHEVFLYNDIIVKAGAIGDCMYFISNGTVAVSTPTGKEICHLQDGAYFGEIALISKDQKRVANVVAIEICEIYRLDRRNFRNCFPTNSVFYKKIEQIAQERMEKTVLLEELHKKYVLERTTKHKAEEAQNIDIF